MNLFRFLAAVLVASAVHAPAHADAIDAFVQAELQRQEIPGVAVGIFRNGQIVKVQGYGLANLEHGIPVKPETVFQTASIGKMFTATAVMLLVEEGKLSLDAPLTRYLPDAPPTWEAITLRHLLNHTSGVGDPGLDLKQDYSEDEMLARIYAAPPEFPPGRRWSYSNPGYATAGIIVGRVGGQHYGELLQTRVFKPNGMTGARLLSHIDIVPDRAAGYEWVGDVRDANASKLLKNQDWVSVTLNQTADGSLQMSVLDFAAWDGVVARRGVLKPESWQEVLRPAPLKNGTVFPYGFGWSLADGSGSGPRYIHHSGGWQGFSSDFRRYDSDGVSFVVLANTNRADAQAIVQGIAERFDRRYEEASPTDKVIEDKRPELSRKLGDVLQTLGSDEVPGPDLMAGLKAERRERVLASMRRTLKEAGPCQTPMELAAESVNGDLLSRTYRINCAKGRLRASPVFDESGEVVGGGLRLEKP